MGSDQYIQQTLKMLSTGWQLGKNMGARTLRRDLEKAGYDHMTIEAAVEQFKANKPIDGILAQANAHMQKLAAREAILAAPPDYKGSARWSTAADLTAKGVAFGSSIKALPGDVCILGTIDEGAGLAPQAPPTYVGLRGAGHLMTIAPTRSGKSATQIVANLLNYRGSTVVLDPKGELFTATSAWRAAHVGPVYVINPFGFEPLGDFTHGFNPFDGLKVDTDADNMAAILHPENPHAKDGKFFDAEVQAFLAAAIQTMHLYFPRPERTLGTLRDLIGSYNADFQEFVALMADKDAPSFIRNRGGVVAQYDTRERNRLLASMNESMRIWDSEGLRQCTARSDIDFRDLKKHPATVYLILPISQIKTYSNFVKVLFAAALDAMEREPTVPDIPVLFILDEFLRLDPFPKFTDALHTHAGLGANFWFFLQDIPLLKERYKETWESFFSGTAARMYYGCEDLATTEVISKTLDQKTIAYLAANAGHGGGSSSTYSLNESLVYEGRDLMRPNEVKRHLSQVDPISQWRYGLATLKTVEDPIKTVQRTYWTDPVLARRIGSLSRAQLETIR